MIHLLRSRATKQQIEEMAEELGAYIKLAVDVRNGILAGGGALHADCEAVFFNEGSPQEDIWGADWIPSTRQLRYEALINIRPHQNNLSMEILDPSIRNQVREMVGRLLESV